MHKTRVLGSTLSAVLLIAAAGCSPPDPIEAPPVPGMPDHWVVTSNETFAAADIRPVAQALNANVAALRNTEYDAGGTFVKLNTIVAASPDDADAIVAAIAKIKPAEFTIRHGLIVYEFVGADDALPEIRAGRDLLAARLNR